MHLAVLIVLTLLTLAAWSIAGALGKIAEHNGKFAPPPPESSVAIDAGDVIVVRAFGTEQVCTVKGLALHPDGYVVVAAEPVGATPA